MGSTVTKTAAGDSTMTAVVLLWFVGAWQSGNWAMSMEVAVAATGLLTRILDAIKEWLPSPPSRTAAPPSPVSPAAATVAVMCVAWLALA